MLKTLFTVLLILWLYFESNKWLVGCVIIVVVIIHSLIIIFFTPGSLLISGKGKVAQQAASYGEIREGKETARDEEIWQKGTWSSALKTDKFNSCNGQFPLWDAPAGNHGTEVALIVLDWIFVLMNTTTIIPCRHVWCTTCTCISNLMEWMDWVPANSNMWFLAQYMKLVLCSM